MPLTDARRQELRAKYREERDKRLRPDGNEQYIEPKGKFAHYVEDPYVERVERDPIVQDIEVAVVGAGFGGLSAGAHFALQGITDVWLIDGAGDVGGVWYWNRYPGAMCDTAAMVYLPLLEETGYLPSAKYVHAPEIFAHAKRIAHTFHLYDHALFSTNVLELRWDESLDRWLVRTDRGDELRARFVVTGTGPLHRPKLPGIEGIESYEGHTFHTSRWDYGYTGGSPEGALMENLRDKRVGIIGTGATSVQCIPHLAKTAKDLFVFQRTPSSIDIRNNRPLGPEMAESLQPGWQREWLMNFVTLQTGQFAEVDLVEDGWTDITKRIRDRVVADMGESGGRFSPELMARAYEDCDDEKMEEIRERVDTIVTDPATAEALKPWYRQLCKRPCFHDEFLPVFNQPNVHLIDTHGQGVRTMDAHGLWVGEDYFELDCVIFASGFEVGTSYARRSGFETVGRHGETLSQAWSDGMESLHGIHVANFPNLFIIGPTQGANLWSNITHNLTEAGQTIALIVSHAKATGAEVVEPSAEAVAQWIGAIEAVGRRGLLGGGDCTPGYYNNEGKEMGRRELLNSSGYPEGSLAYFHYIDKWRTSGEFAGLTFTPAHA